MLWIILTLTSAILYAISHVLEKNAFKKDKINSFGILLTHGLIGTIILFLFFNSKINFFDIANINVLLSIFFGILFSLIYFHLLEKYDISVVSPMLNLSPMILIFFTYFFLGEILNIFQIFGIIIIIVSTYFLEMTIHLHKKQNKNHMSHFIDIKNKEVSFYILVGIMLFAITFLGFFSKKAFSQNVDVFSYLFLYYFSLLIFSSVYFLKDNSKIKNVRKSKFAFFGAFLELISTKFNILHYCTSRCCSKFSCSSKKNFNSFFCSFWRNYFS